VPKPVSATLRKPKQAVLDAPVPPTQIPAEIRRLSLATPIPSREVPNDALTEVSSPAKHSSMHDFSFQLTGTSPAAVSSPRKEITPHATPVELPSVEQKKPEPVTANSVLPTADAPAKSLHRSKKVSLSDVSMDSR
jgi:hypothetical protein